jgi:hypothetical protein
MSWLRLKTGVNLYYLKVIDNVSGLIEGNEQWHADMQYHPRRCGYSMLRAVEIPPHGYGGQTLLDETNCKAKLNTQIRGLHTMT